LWSFFSCNKNGSDLIALIILLLHYCSTQSCHSWIFIVSLDKLPFTLIMTQFRVLCYLSAIVSERLPPCDVL
jgi:hypothetical protein